MKNHSNNSRRNFVSNSLKSAAFIGAGAVLTSTVLNPLATLAQGSPSTLQARILALGTLFLQTSQLALTKAANPTVKLFAKFEAAEQQTMGRILKEMGTPAQQPSPEEKAMLTKLQPLSGAAFDKAFMQGQVTTHQKLRQAVSSLNAQRKDMHVKHLTSLALSTIQEHTEVGQMLLNKLA